MSRPHDWHRKYTERHINRDYGDDVPHQAPRYTITETLTWRLKKAWKNYKLFLFIILIILLLVYIFNYGSNEKTSETENNLQVNQNDTVKSEMPAQSVRYNTSPKNITLNYILRGKRSSINFQVYRGLNDYLSGLPRYYYCEPTCPSTEELNLKFINNDEQREFLLPLIRSIKNKTQNEDDRVRIAVSVVQKIPYDYDSIDNNHEEKYPYQVLYENKGLCGEKSKLLAFILKELGYGTVLFDFDIEQHQSVGIKCPNQFSLLGTGYCFIESTHPTIITYLPTTYFGVGELKTIPKISKISDGKSFDSVSEESDDMAVLKAMESLGPILNEDDYKLWKKLEWKYDLIENKE